MRSVKSFLPWVWAWAVAAAAFVLLVVEMFNEEASSVTFGLVGVALTLLFTFLGALIAVRQPGNRISWLLLVVGLGLLITGATAPLTGVEPVDPNLLHSSALVLDSWVGLSMIFYPMVLITYLFPTGQFFTSRQRWVGWLGAVMVPASLLVALSVTEIGPGFQEPEEAWAIANPIGFLPQVAIDVTSTLWGLALVALAFGGLWSMVNRYRRSSVVVKAQIKWMMLASLFLAVGFVLIVATDTDSTISGIVTSSAFASIPVSIAIAITRYRLFEIDRIISRTLTYILVVAMLGATYVGVITLVTALIASQNALAVAAATLAVAALFNPLRKRIQRAIDRRFNRSGYDPEVVSKQLASRLQSSLRAEEILEAWADTVAASLQPKEVASWINDAYVTQIRFSAEVRPDKRFSS